MKKILVTIFAALSLATMANAVPAYPGLISYTQPDGSVIQIRLHGDEFCHWTTDAAGNIIEKDSNGFYRPASEASLAARRAAGKIRRAAVNSRRRSQAKTAAVGQQHFLVILVEFQDIRFSYTRTDLSNLLNEHNYSTNGGTGSARDYYYDNSKGYFEPIFDVYGPVLLDNNRAYYGGNDSNGDDLRPHEAVAEGCQGLDSEINFAQFDNDTDEEVDLVIMYYAGQGEADGGPEESIWPHQWDLSSAGSSALYLDGKKIGKYACFNEIVTSGAMSGGLDGIGTVCHEFGHALGLPDFYDTDYNYHNGYAGGLYDYSIMCGGSYNNNGRTPPYFNIEERIMLGWLQPSVIREFVKSGTYTLPSVHGNVAYKTPTDMDGEYFLYECRAKTGWDRYIPEEGLIVYHVDRSSRNVSIYSEIKGTNINVTAANLWSNWEKYNSINENGSHPCFYVVPAGDQSSLRYRESAWAFPGTGSNHYTSFTATSWNGVDSDVQLSNISFANNQVTLYARVPSSTLSYNTINNPGNGVYNAGDSFALNLQESEAQPVSSVEWYFDDEPASGSVTLTAGTHVVEAHLTLESGEIKILELTILAQ